MSRNVHIIFWLCLFLALAALPVQGAVGECAEGKAGLRCRAEQGVAQAQYELGMKYLNGEFPEESHLKGLQWLNQAAKQGHREASYVLDRMALSSEPGQGCSASN